MNIFVIYKPNSQGWYSLIPHIVNKNNVRDVKMYPVQCISKDLSTLRLPFLGWGLRKVERQLGDHADIIETWM